jgi:alkylation response protein AidB-like acyl-CoA dehydrogenase
VDFEDSPEEAAFRAEVRAFLEANATPKTGTDADWSRNAAASDPDVRADFEKRSREWQRVLYDNGWAGITWPEQFGGRGATPAQSIIFNEEALKYDVSSGFIGAAQQLVGPPIMYFGSDEQKARYLGPLLRGD